MFLIGSEDLTLYGCLENGEQRTSETETPNPRKQAKKKRERRT